MPDDPGDASNPERTAFQFGETPTEPAPEEVTRSLPSDPGDQGGSGFPVTSEVRTDSETPPPPAPISGSEQETRSMSSGATTGQDMTRTDPATPRHSPGGFVRREGMGSWGTVQADGSLEPGQVVFGRYLVKQQLGRGGMGTVWLVRHVTLDSDRALKMIVANIAFNAEALARFRREAQVMARFNHPNAVTVHDAVLDNDVAFIEMELVQGKSLDKVIERGKPMPLAWTIRIARQLCDVLQVAHDQGIIHRDLKPSNLMLLDNRPPGQDFLKVLDFGIAKILGAEDADIHTVTNAFMGTPPYTSPEQANGHADARSDIYSVGVMLYELLTGYRPFSGPIVKQIHDTCYTPAPSFETINPEVKVAPEVEKLVLRCLAKNPDERPQSARELMEDLERADPSTATSTATSTTIVLEPSRSLWLWLLAAGAVMALIGGGLVLRSALTTTEIDVSPARWTSPLAERYEAVYPGGKPTPGLPLLLRRKTDGARFRLIPGGSFRMGDIGREGQIPPTSEVVTLPSFYMQESEVTNAQFRRYLEEMQLEPPLTWKQEYDRLVTNLRNQGMLDEDAHKLADQHPAVGMTHGQAHDYAEWAGGSLPTSAQWEYAARSRGQPGRLYVWGASPAVEPGSPKAYIDAETSSGDRTVKVCSFNDDQTEQNIFDLTGNVREWTATKSRGSQPRPGSPQSYVVRGGAGFEYIADLFSTTAHQDVPESEALENLGFRIVLDPEAPAP